MMCIAFLFCLCPGKYTGTMTGDQAFALNDVVLFIGTQRLHNEHSSKDELQASTSLQLAFTIQKNNDQGAIIVNAQSNNVICCPVLAAIRQLLFHCKMLHYLHLSFDGSIKLSNYYNFHDVSVPVKASMITTTMHIHAALLEPATDIAPKKISACLLQAGGGRV